MRIGKKRERGGNSTLYIIIYIYIDSVSQVLQCTLSPICSLITIVLMGAYVRNQTLVITIVLMGAYVRNQTLVITIVLIIV